LESDWRWTAFLIAWPNLFVDMAARIVWSDDFKLALVRLPKPGYCELWLYQADSSNNFLPLVSLGSFPATGFPYGFPVLPDH
jgi:hypothetical protein